MCRQKGINTRFVGCYQESITQLEGGVEAMHLHCQEIITITHLHHLNIGISHVRGEAEERQGPSF